MKKIKVNLKIKNLLMIGLIILLGGMGLLYYEESQNIETTTEEKSVYDYTFDTQMKYAVNVFPNTLYSEEQLGEDQMYLTEFVKSIDTHFVTNFTGSESAKISGEYQIIAQVAGYITQQENKQDIWSKTFEISPLQTFQGEGKDFQVEKAAQVDYRSYNEFAKNISEATKVNASTELRVMMTGKMTVETPYEILEYPIQSTILIPLENSYFAVTKVKPEEVKESVKETVTLPSDQKHMTNYLVGMGMTLLLFLGVAFLTEPLTAEDLKKQKIRKLFTNYGSRMVGVDQIEESKYTTKYTVSSLSDLIKIADELEKPLLYRAHRDITQITSFHVMQGEIIYTYEVKSIQSLKLQDKSPLETEQISIES